MANILIVDDSIFIQRQLSQIINSGGHSVISTALDGLEAIEKYKKMSANIDLVTLDITMPHMDGLEALERLLEIDPNISVIMISALGKDDIVKKALFIGASSYIVKPLEATEVLEKIRSALNSSAKKRGD